MAIVEIGQPSEGNSMNTPQDLFWVGTSVVERRHVECLIENYRDDGWDVFHFTPMAWDSEYNEEYVISRDDEPTRYISRVNPRVNDGSTAILLDNS